MIKKNLKKMSMKRLSVIITAALFMSFYACKDDETDKINDPSNGEPIDITYDFDSGTEGWDAGIAGYPVDDESLYEFEARQEDAPFDDTEGVLVLSASNPDNNLFMYLSRQISGLEPNTTYEADLTVNFTSDVLTDTTGVPGDTTGVPGDTTGVAGDSANTGTGASAGIAETSDTLILKAGVVPVEVTTEPDEQDFLQLVGIDIGDSGSDGADLIVIGTYPGNGADTGYQIHTASPGSPFTVTTNEDGDFWLIVAAESFGTQTTLYISSIEVRISEE